MGRQLDFLMSVEVDEIICGEEHLDRTSPCSTGDTERVDDWIKTQNSCRSNKPVLVQTNDLVFTHG